MGREEISQSKSKRAYILLFIITAVLVFILLTSQVSLRRSNYKLNVGDVSTKDITAPRTVTFVSDILTAQARKDAEENVSDVFLPADPTISRAQVQNLRYTFQFITTVRGDEYSTLPQKINDINSIALTRFDESTISQMLELSSDDWSKLQEESLRVLESVMQNSIRETQLISEIENIPAMINYYINQNIANLVTVFVSRFVTANSLYSEELTMKNREEASAAVQPRERTFVINQTVVQRGQVINDLSYEALDKLGLVTSRSGYGKYVSVLCILLGLSGFFLVFSTMGNMGRDMGFKAWLLVAVLFLIFLTAGRLTTPNHTIMPYIFPLQALGLTVTVLFGKMPAVVVSVIAGILLPYDFTAAAPYMVYYIATSIAALIILGRGRQIVDFLIAGGVSGLIGIPIIVAFQFTNSAASPDTLGLLTLAGASIVSGLFSSALALIFQYVLSGPVGVTTPIQLMELLRPESPLLQHLLQTAPGTYQHSLQVANLAEQAARDIGADPLLTRAGAMYHDVGKTLNPSFFVENQVSGHLDTHEEMSPKESAAIIIRHVSDGVDLARKNHLPDTIIDFIRQHHGTNQTRYQLSQAVKELGEENVDPADFTYQGPKPQFKEAALVMLADSTEARARAERPTNDEEICALVKSVFSTYNSSEQLDDTPLTLHDLTIARESFERVLRNIYHPRVKYPNANENDQKKGGRKRSSGKKSEA